MGGRRSTVRRCEFFHGDGREGGEGGRAREGARVVGAAGGGVVDSADGGRASVRLGLRGQRGERGGQGGGHTSSSLLALLFAFFFTRRSGGGDCFFGAAGAASVLWMRDWRVSSRVGPRRRDGGLGARRWAGARRRRRNGRRRNGRAGEKRPRHGRDGGGEMGGRRRRRVRCCDVASTSWTLHARNHRFARSFK